MDKITLMTLAMVMAAKGKTTTERKVKEVPRSVIKQPRNEKCLCGSDVKHKKCCGSNERHS